MIAATDKVSGLTVVARNVADVKALGIPLLNPFKPQRDSRLACRILYRVTQQRWLTGSVTRQGQSSMVRFTAVLVPAQWLRR